VFQNSAKNEASVFYIIGGTSRLTNINFFNNSALSCGFVANNMLLLVENCKFIINKSKIKSKNIYSTNSNVTISNSYFFDGTPVETVTGSFL